MKKEKSSAMGTPYTFEGRIPLKQAIPLGLQHVMAMFIGNLTPLLIIMGACGLTADAGYGALRTALLQNAMTVAGIVTLVQMFSIGPIGGKVPIVMGTSSGFLGVFKSVTAVLGQGALTYGAILGATIVGGLFGQRVGHAGRRAGRPAHAAAGAAGAGGLCAQADRGPRIHDAVGVVRHNKAHIYRICRSPFPAINKDKTASNL